MTYDSGPRSYNALIIGAVVVVLALAVFLIFRGGGDQQAAFEPGQPAITAPPALKENTPGGPTAPPMPAPESPAQPEPKEPGDQ